MIIHFYVAMRQDWRQSEAAGISTQDLLVFSFWLFLWLLGQTG